MNTFFRRSILSILTKSTAILGVFVLGCFFLLSPAQAYYQYDSQFGSFGTGDGQFRYPEKIAFDSTGNIYVTEYTGNRIQKFDSSGVYQSQFGSSGTGNGQFNNPIGIAFDSTGNIYVVDRGNYRIQKFDASGVYQSQFGSSGTGNGQFESPWGIAFDSTGNIYVADSGNHRIQKFDSSGVYQSQFGSSGSGNGQFNFPTNIAFDSTGDIYVLDSQNNRIQKFDSSGVYQSQFGSSGSGNGQFYFPRSIAFDSTGNIYVADDGNSRIQKFDASGVYQSQFSSPAPRGIAFDSTGNIYVTDPDSFVIRKYLHIPVTLSSTSLSVTEGEQTTYTIDLDSVPSDDVTFTLSTTVPDPGSGITVSPSSLTFTPSNWDTPKTITVTAIDDSSIDGDRYVTISSVVTSDDSDYDGVVVPDVDVDIAEDDTIGISTCAELQAMSNDLAAPYSLSTDIDCAGFDPGNDGKGFIPVGNSSTPFTGTFDGHGHTISNLTIVRPDEEYVGLFGYVSGSTLQNVTITGSIEGLGYTGALVGYTEGTMTIDAVSSSATITGHASGNIGGLVGRADSLTISTSSTTGTLNAISDSSTSNIGGLVGWVGGVLTITTSHASGNILITTESSDARSIGGLVGYANSGAIDSSYTTGGITVNSGDYVSSGVGGLVGHSSDIFDITSSYTTGHISVIATDFVEYGVGGLVGEYYGGTIDRSYAIGDITVHAGVYAADVGGLIGSSWENAESASITNSFSQSNLSVTADTDIILNVGGIMGSNNNSPIAIDQSYATGDLTLTAGTSITSVGGFIGQSSSFNSITNTFSTGAIALTSGTDDTSNIGGFLGDNGGGTLTNNFYDKTASTRAFCTGIDDPDPLGCTGVNALGTEPAYFKGNNTNSPLDVWDFDDVWATVADNYPILQDLTSPYPTSAEEEGDIPSRASIDSWQASLLTDKSSCPTKLKLTIKGKHFDDDIEVYIGGKKSSAVDVSNSKKLSAKFCLPKLLKVKNNLKRTVSVKNPDTDSKKADKKIDLSLYSFLIAPTSTTFNQDTKEGILNIQKYLVTQKLLTKAQMTGIYNDVTREAIKAFQKKHGIPQTGNVGPRTRGAMGG